MLGTTITRAHHCITLPLRIAQARSLRQLSALQAAGRTPGAGKLSDRYCIRIRQETNPAPFVHRRGRGKQAASDFHYIDLFAHEAARLINLAPMREHTRLYHACNKPATVVQPRQQVPIQRDRPANVLRARRRRRRLYVSMARTLCFNHTLQCTRACTVSTM